MLIRNNENGFVLVTALIIMLVLTIIGIAATTNTSLELQIAGNDKVHNSTFYGAEGAAIIGAELLEQNINCALGFLSSDIEPGNHITVDSDHLDFYFNEFPDETDILDDSTADIRFPLAYHASSTDDTYLRIGGSSKFLDGEDLIQHGEYEGNTDRARGRLYDIYARHQGPNNSQSIIVLRWRHVGMATTCYY